MKKILISLSLMMVAGTASAKDCYEALTSGYTKDSQAFQLSEDEVGNFDDIGIEYANAALHALATKLECGDQLKVDAKLSECSEIVPGVASSEACYLHTNLGYFIVNTDYLMNTNLVFNRWD